MLICYEQPSRLQSSLLLEGWSTRTSMQGQYTGTDSTVANKRHMPSHITAAEDTSIMHCERPHLYLKPDPSLSFMLNVAGKFQLGSAALPFVLLLQWQQCCAAAFLGPLQWHATSGVLLLSPSKLCWQPV